MTPATALPACRVNAFAKLNLDLRVLGVRPDGYHELATVFQSVDLGDVLHIESGGSGGIEIACSDPRVPRDDRNLVSRAAHHLCRALELEVPDLRVRIDKTIPTQAGLGGGSANAAAMLTGLNAMLGKPASPLRLTAVAVTLGADVPFMLLGGAALGTGRGDILRPLPDLPLYEVVIVHPGFGVSTAEAYRWFDQARRVEAPSPVWPTTSTGWGEALAACTNDLEAPVASRHPEIAGLVRTLRAGGARLAAMTGSGSGVFGLFAPGEAAAQVARRIAGAGRFVTIARTLGKAEFDRLTLPALVSGDR